MYHVNSFRRLCSATSLDGGVAKSLSSVVIRERRPSILFSMMTVSCKWVGQKGFQAGGRKRTS